VGTSLTPPILGERSIRRRKKGLSSSIKRRKGGFACSQSGAALKSRGRNRKEMEAWRTLFPPCCTEKGKRAGARFHRSFFRALKGGKQEKKIG